MKKYKVLSFKRKTKLSVMNTNSKLLNNHGVHPPLSEPPTEFSKKKVGDLTGPQLLEGILWERGGCAKDEKLWYFWCSVKNLTFREDWRKTNIEGVCLKRGASTVSRFKGGLCKKEEVVLLRGELIPQYTLWQSGNCFLIK